MPDPTEVNKPKKASRSASKKRSLLCPQLPPVAIISDMGMVPPSLRGRSRLSASITAPTAASRGRSRTPHSVLRERAQSCNSVRSARSAGAAARSKSRGRKGKGGKKGKKTKKAKTAAAGVAVGGKVKCLRCRSHEGIV